MKTMVRNTVLKMKGLNTYQFSDSSANTSTSNGLSCWNFADLLCPQDLVLSNMLTSGTDLKAHIRSARKDATISNGTNATLVFRIYYLQCRKATSDSLSTLMADGAPSYFYPYSDPTTSDAFRRYFTITKRKVKYLPAGKVFRVSLSRFWRSGRAVSGDYEGLSTYRFTPLSCAVMIFCDTVPMEDTAVGNLVSTAIAKFNMITHAKYTWYNDQDNDPISTGVNGLSTAAGAYRLYTDEVIMTEAIDA